MVALWFKICRFLRNYILKIVKRYYQRKIGFQSKKKNIYGELYFRTIVWHHWVIKMKYYPSKEIKAFFDIVNFAEDYNSFLLEIFFRPLSRFQKEDFFISFLFRPFYISIPEKGFIKTRTFEITLAIPFVYIYFLGGGRYLLIRTQGPLSQILEISKTNVLHYKYRYL